VAEGLLVVQAFAFHQRALGLLDQHPGVQGSLELGGQGTFDLSLDRGCEQAGHHPGIGLQGPDLGVVPAPWVDGVDVKGSDRAAAQLDGDADPRADLDLDEGEGDLAPATLQGRVVHDRRLAGGIRLGAGAGGEDLLVVRS
jgi:hypothetical protein